MTATDTTTRRAVVDRTHLVRAIGQVKAAAAGSGSALRACTAVRLTVADGVMRLSATDLEITVATTIPATGDIDVAVPARKFADVIRWADGPVELRASDESHPLDAPSPRLTATWGRNSVEFAAVPLVELPRPVEDLPNEVKISPADLQRIMRVVNCASRDDARPILTGISIDGTHAAATDSYRLAIAELEEPLPLVDPLLIPARAFRHLPRLLPMEAATLEHLPLTVRLTVAETEITTVQISGDFPNWRGLLRKDSPTNVTFPRAQLVDAIHVAKALMGPNDAVPVRFEMSGNTATIRSDVQDVGRSSTPIDITVDGPGVEITAAFNARYLLDLLAMLDGETVTFGMVDALKPMQVHEDRLTVLLMPVRVS